MRIFDSWTAFLLVLFGVVGLCGFFASYATSIPLERGTARVAAVDRALEPGLAGPERERLRPLLGTLADLVLDRPGPPAERAASARRVIEEEQRRESASIGFRVRLMLGTVTILAAALGCGVLALARRNAPHGAMLRK